MRKPNLDIGSSLFFVGLTLKQILIMVGNLEKEMKFWIKEHYGENQKIKKLRNTFSNFVTAGKGS